MVSNTLITNVSITRDAFKTWHITGDSASDVCKLFANIMCKTKSTTIKCTLKYSKEFGYEVLFHFCIPAYPLLLNITYQLHNVKFGDDSKDTLALISCLRKLRINTFRDFDDIIKSPDTLKNGLLLSKVF